MTSFDLTGKKAIVTGAAGGLGFGMAQGLYNAGVDVVLMDASPKVTESAATLTGKGKAIGMQVNLTDWETLEARFNSAVAALGGLDFLVNGAGIARRMHADVSEDKDWDDVINVNLKATFKMCQYASKVMLPQGFGRIVNIASMNSIFGGCYIASYTASKGGVNQLTKALSNEWSARGINVNAIAPGYMMTQMNAYYQNTEEGLELKKVIDGRIPKGRWGTPEDMAGVVVFLCSPASDYITGATIPLDGGYSGR